ncbi:MAG: hypothetical protein WBA93_02275 [Microcoleaceae cyanobacterium]
MWEVWEVWEKLKNTYPHHYYAGRPILVLSGWLDGNNYSSFQLDEVHIFIVLGSVGSVGSVGSSQQVTNIHPVRYRSLTFCC